jgi:hypothetical protein
MKTLLAACMAAFLCYASGAAAQVIFKQTDDTGRTIFTDRPDPAARTVAMYVAAQYKDAPAQSDYPVLRPVAPIAMLTDVERALQNMARMSSPRAATVDANEAARRMRQQQRAHAKGAETVHAEPTVNGAAVAQIRARFAVERPGQRLSQIPLFRFLAVGYILLALALALAFLAFNALRLIGSVTWPSMPTASLQ